MLNKRAMISQPMAGKTDEEIAEARDRAHAKLREMGYEFVNTLFTDEWYSDEAMEERGVVQIPLCYLFGHYDALCGLDSCGTDVWQRLADLIDRPSENIERPR